MDRNASEQSRCTNCGATTCTSPYTMPKCASAALLIAVVICAICTLFPPRRIQNTSSFQFDKREDGKLAAYDVPRAFLFSPEFGIYRGPNAWVFPAEIDAGRLLAQLVLIGTLTVLIFVPILLQSKQFES